MTVGTRGLSEVKDKTRRDGKGPAACTSLPSPWTCGSWCNRRNWGLGFSSWCLGTAAWAGERPWGHLPAGDMWEDVLPLPGCPVLSPPHTPELALAVWAVNLNHPILLNYFPNDMISLVHINDQFHVLFLALLKKKKNLIKLS